jgi:hypothetical protein
MPLSKLHESAFLLHETWIFFNEGYSAQVSIQVTAPAEGVAPDSERVKRTYGGYAALSAR